MARPARPEPATVFLGLEVSGLDAARIDEVLARPEFTGWTREQWCYEIIQTALRYYVGDRPGASPRQQPSSRQPASRQPASRQASSRQASPRPRRPPEPPPETRPPDAGPPPPEPEPSDSFAAEPEPVPACPHPADARDYQRGICAACGAILWD